MTKTTKYITYLRVSTDKQGLTGYGMDAQRAAISNYLRGAEPIQEYIEVESGKNDARPELLRAIEHCKKAKATLIIAKLDRLSRKMSFVANLLDSSVDFVACDNPHANRLTIHILAAIAEHEREMISKRTKDALAAAKAKGVVLGGNRGGTIHAAQRRAAEIKQADALKFSIELYPKVKMALDTGKTKTAAADLLNRQGLSTAKGHLWCPKAVSRVIQYVERARG